MARERLQEKQLVDKDFAHIKDLRSQLKICEERRFDFEAQINKFDDEIQRKMVLAAENESKLNKLRAADPTVLQNRLRV